MRYLTINHGGNTNVVSPSHAQHENLTGFFKSSSLDRFSHSFLQRIERIYSWFNEHSFVPDLDSFKAYWSD